MRKTIIVLTLTAICGFSRGQSLIWNANTFYQLKNIVDKLSSITYYQVDCDLVITSPVQGTLHSASTLNVKKMPNDTLCGYYYYFKTHEQYRNNDLDFLAFFNNAFYRSMNNSINKYSLFEEPDKFKDTEFTTENSKGVYPAIQNSSIYLRVLPKELSEFIDKSLSDNETVIAQRPDTLINGQYCLKYIIKANNTIYALSTELCFQEDSFSLIYYKSSSGGLNPQYIEATLSNTQIDQELPANYFSEENLFGRKLGKNSKEISFEELKIGETVPEWELPILGKSTKCSSKELRGKYILLEFTGTWCPHCWDAVKMMNRLEDEFVGNKMLSIQSVFSTETDTEEKIIKFAKEQKIKSTILYSAKSVGDKFKVYAYPTFFFIDPNGILIKIKNGYSQEIEKEIIDLIKNSIK